MNGKSCCVMGVSKRGVSHCFNSELKCEISRTKVPSCIQVRHVSCKLHSRCQQEEKRRVTVHGALSNQNGKEKPRRYARQNERVRARQQRRTRRRQWTRGTDGGWPHIHNLMTHKHSWTTDVFESVTVFALVQMMGIWRRRRRKRAPRSPHPVALK